MKKQKDLSSGIYYSPNARGFFLTSVHDEIPDDVIEISEADYNALLDEQTRGLAISIDKDGHLAAREEVMTPEELIQIAEQEKRELIQQASEKIQILQDAVDLGIATEAEENELKEWRAYRVHLSRIDTSNISDIEKGIKWPKAPVG